MMFIFLDNRNTKTNIFSNGILLRWGGIWVYSQSKQVKLFY